MKVIFQKWWRNNDKQFSIINYRKSWKEVGNQPRVKFFTNGAKRRNGDSCLDVHLILGYTIFNYTNFNLQGWKPDPEQAYLQAEREGMKEG